MMMAAWSIIMLAVLVAVIIAVLFALFALAARRSAEKSKRDEKPKRGDHSRLTLGDDGELIEITDDDHKHDTEYR